MKIIEVNKLSKNFVTKKGPFFIRYFLAKHLKYRFKYKLYRGSK